MVDVRVMETTTGLKWHAKKNADQNQVSGFIVIPKSYRGISAK
jgi:hypothetical protein